jgi:hypothetical protein
MSVASLFADEGPRGFGILLDLRECLKERFEAASCDVVDVLVAQLQFEDLLTSSIAARCMRRSAVREPVRTRRSVAANPPPLSTTLIT